MYMRGQTVFWHFSYVTFIIAEQKGPAEEKFNKLKGMYGKLREEHIQLLRTVS